MEMETGKPEEENQGKGQEQGGEAARANEVKEEESAKESEKESEVENKEGKEEEKREEKEGEKGEKEKERDSAVQRKGTFSKLSAPFKSEGRGGVKGPFWCSWCYKECLIEVLSTSLLRRTIYRCLGCEREVARCVLCSVGLARHHRITSTSDKLCASCDGTVETWSAEDIEKALADRKKGVFKKSFCSWCFHLSDHKKVHTKNMLMVHKRNKYVCDTCHRDSIPCRFCENMARAAPHFTDTSCAVCDGTLESIDESEERKREAITLCEKWCSWCVEKSDHILFQKNSLARNVYDCVGCGQRSLQCMTCKVAMTRGGLGWDDNMCAMCKREIDGWEETHARKQQIFNQSLQKERVEAELFRDISMPSEVRNRLACFLGWPLITSKTFGDPHGEAFEILHATNGIVSRAVTSIERVNPLSAYVDWISILTRVHTTAFGAPPTHTYSHTWESEKEEREEESEKEMEKDKDGENKSVPLSLFLSRSSSSVACGRLEEDVLGELVRLQRQAMSEEQWEELKRDMKSDKLKTMLKDVEKNTGIVRNDVLMYSVAILKKVVSDTANVSEMGLAILALNMGAKLLPALGTVTVPVVSALTSLATPLAVLGLVSLARTGWKLALSSSEGRLLAPVALILNQRILLGAAQIRLEDYY